MTQLFYSILFSLSLSHTLSSSLYLYLPFPLSASPALSQLLCTFCYATVLSTHIRIRISYMLLLIFHFQIYAAPSMPLRHTAPPLATPLAFKLASQCGPIRLKLSAKCLRLFLMSVAPNPPPLAMSG